MESVDMSKEIWKGLEDINPILKDLEVSNYGRFRNKLTMKQINLCKIKGYSKNSPTLMNLIYKGHTYSAMKLIFKSFNKDYIEGKTLHTIDGNKSNLRFDNIEYVDGSCNLNRCMLDDVPWSKLSNDDALLVKRECLYYDLTNLFKGISHTRNGIISKLIEKYKVDTGTINQARYQIKLDNNTVNINSSNRWKSIKLSEKEINNIIKLAIIDYLKSTDFEMVDILIRNDEDKLNEKINNFKYQFKINI